MIRKATMDDINDCVALMQEYFTQFLELHGVPVVYNDVWTTAKDTINARQLLVVDHDGKVKGIAGWAMVAHPANSQVKIFYETIWCVKSEFKMDALLLLRALEREAEKVKADLIVMANLSTKSELRLNRIFKKRGFNFIETHYGKTIGE